MASRSNKMPMTATGFNAYKDLKMIIEQCAKSDAPTVEFRGQTFDTPIDRHEAIKLLDDCNDMKWNPKLRSLSKYFTLEFK